MTPQKQPGHQRGGGPIFPSFLHLSNIFSITEFKGAMSSFDQSETRGSTYHKGSTGKMLTEQVEGPTSEDWPTAGPAQRLPRN